MNVLMDVDCLSFPPDKIIPLILVFKKLKIFLGHFYQYIRNNYWIMELINNHLIKA